MNARAVYRTSTIKRQRRSKADITRLRETIYEVVQVDQPMSVRQVFYRLVSEGVIDKSEKEYHTTVCRLLKDMRLEGELPWTWIADSTRWMRKPPSHNNIREALAETATFYRRNMWHNLPARVEIWLEKDALAGVLYEVTEMWDVPLMVTRGYPSLSFLAGAAASIQAAERPVYLYYFGDWDPSGVDIDRNLEARLRQFAPEAELFVERIAVIERQINEMHLQTRPTKKTDSRSKNFKGESVEVDAIPPRTLKTLCRSCSTRHIDAKALYDIRQTEDLERESVERLLDLPEAVELLSDAQRSSSVPAPEKPSEPTRESAETDAEPAETDGMDTETDEATETAVEKQEPEQKSPSDLYLERLREEQDAESAAGEELDAD